MQQVVFRLQRTASIASVTEGRSVVLETWCNLESDFIQVLSGTDTEAAEVLEDIEKRFGPDVFPSVRGAGSQKAALIRCPSRRSPEKSVSATVECQGGVLQLPVTSKDGWETFRVIFLDDTKVAAALRSLQKLGPFELLSKRSLDAYGAMKFLVPSAELLDGLTRRQADAIVAAVESGYYDQPRATTIAHIAKRMGLSRASLEEHLRKAENKLMKAIAPFVAVQATSLEPARPRGRSIAGIRRAKGHPHPRPASPAGP